MPILAEEYMLGNYLLMSINKAKMKKFQFIGIYYLIIIFLILEIYVFKFIPEPKHDFKICMTKVIYPIESIRASAKQIEEHNSRLREYLYNRISVVQTAATTREASFQQMRGFYIVLLGGLLSIFFLKASDKVEIFGVIMLIIVIMYLLEVNHQDIIERYIKNNSTVLTKAVYILVDSKNDSVWYSYDKKPGEEVLKREKEFATRFKRKLLSAQYPKPDQFALYFIPFLFLACWKVKQRGDRLTNH